MKTKNRIDPTESIQVAGLGLEEISICSAAIKSFHGYTDVEGSMKPLLRKAVEEGVYKIKKKIDADNNAYRATKVARHISARSEALHMVLAWAFHEIELEKEAFKYMREHAIDELNKGIIK